MYYVAIYYVAITSVDYSMIIVLFLLQSNLAIDISANVCIYTYDHRIFNKANKTHDILQL